MEKILLDIINALRESETAGEAPEDKFLENLIRRHNQNIVGNGKHHAKKKLLPFYLRVKDTQPQRWESWGVTASIEKRLVDMLRMKPRRTASGVATITVITKPWKCASNCLYCPNDVRMPKSYLSDEPACQRAERNYFDPYLQVFSRLRALEHMGHVTDKIELIVLGGTWSDYPLAYQTWFMHELFRALNDADTMAEAEVQAVQRRAFYHACGLSCDPAELAARAACTQRLVHEGSLSYNRAVEGLYEQDSSWREVAARQTATMEQLEMQHALNESAAHRAVGLVIETRPDLVTSENLALIRAMGCTKVQMGVQTLDERLMRLNHRGVGVAKIQEAFELTRLFGFKIHAHFMANLHGSTPEDDKADYARFVTEAPFQPDEVKMYPCALIAGTGLHGLWENGAWEPYSEAELMDVLVENTLVTPPFVRISRMIRDFSAKDIVDGNKKVNLRQMVEEAAAMSGRSIQEIRYREISTGDAAIERLALDDVAYETTATHEHFLQWVAPDGRIAGFLRLSLPKPEAIRARRKADGDAFPFEEGEAMIREVHVYGAATGLNQEGTAAQHHGLGKKLIARACGLALEAGYNRLNVISSIGTREYYRGLGFADAHGGLYQQKALGARSVSGDS